jgi:TonB family protein
MIKNVLLILLTGTVLCNCATAQDTPDSLKNSKFYYFKKSGQLTNNPDSADYTRIISPDTGNSKLYQVEEVYHNGKTKMKCKSLTADMQYKVQGPYITYYSNGNIEASATFDKGMLSGAQFVNFPNGKLYYSSSYDTAKKQLLVNEVRDSTGAVQAENGNGTWVRYYGGYKHLLDQGPIHNGLRDGEWKGRVNDTANYVCTYSNGVSVSGVSRTRSGKEFHFTKDEIQPEYPGGLNAFYKLLGSTVHYPKQAKREGIQGKVFLSFVVEKNGSLSDMHVVRGIGYGCDEEAMRALKTSPPWSPGYQYGIPVRVQYNIPISFTLQGG